MEGKDTRDLESTDAWALEDATPGRRTRPARAIVSVAFKREDFDLVSESAERAGMRTSEFIRTAALAKADPSVDPLMNVSTGTSGILLARAELPPITGVMATVSQDIEVQAFTVA